jgi:predicted nucleotidyltransferase
MGYDPSWDIYKVVHGSRAYGTHTEESDTDTKGVCIAPKEYMLSVHKTFEQHETRDPDSVVYEIRKFCKLASQCNPNIIEVLYCDKKHILTMDSIGEELRENRDLFLSKMAKNGFVGYAHSQLKRLKNHREWNDRPPKHPGTAPAGIPKGEVKKIDDYCNFKYDRYPKNEDLVKAKAHFGMQKSMQWFHAKTYYLNIANYKKYKHWKENRNPERAAMEKKFGYDTKHAYHCIRLLRMGVEIFESGDVLVHRPDAEELLQIRNGEWPYDRILEEADEAIREIDHLSVKSEVLPDTVDMEKVDALCIGLVERKWSRS